MNYKLLFNTAVLAGEIMLKNGAETYRVEDTINHILRKSGFKTIESFVTTTGIFVTLDDNSIDTITSVRRVNIRSTNLNKISLVNEISRNLCDDKINLEEAYTKLSNLDNLLPYNKAIIFISNSLTPFFFAMVFAESIIISELIIALLCGIILSFVQYVCSKFNIIKFFSDLICSMFIAIIASVSINAFNFGNNMDLIIISSIMPLVPGVAITNAIRDTLYGDYLSGLARATEAFIIAVSIALGVGCGLSLFKLL